MSRHRSLKVFALLAGLGSGCANLAPEPTESAGAQVTFASELRFGPDAVASLSSTRRALYTSLASASSVNPDLVFDVKTSALLSIALSWSGGRATAQDNALLFVNSFQPLLDPHVSAGEYVVGSSNQPCDQQVVVLDRVLFGKQVIGSRLTLHFDETDRLVWVTNGVAPVFATLVSPDPTLLPGAVPLQGLMGKVPVQVAQRVRVLAPMPDRSGVYEGDLATWFANGRYRGAVAVGSTATSRELDAQAQGTGRTALPVPLVGAGTNTDVPSLVSYRNLGGVKVNFLEGERNPLESAYRYLEEHPTLFRTGAARCQYVPARFDENPSVPGVFSVRLEQRHGRLPVFGSQIVVALEGLDTVQSVVARAPGSIDVAPLPAFSATDAISAMKETLVSGATAEPPWKPAVDDALAQPATTRLVVMPRFLSRDLQLPQDRLAWRVDRGAFTVLVDALTRQILWGSTSRHGADVVRDARGSDEFGYLFYATAEINGIPQPGAPVPVNTDVSPGLPGGRVSTSMANYEALTARNGWTGLRGRGGDFVANVGVNVSGGGCMPGNAFFDSILTSSAFFCQGMASVDVVGHELTHGVVASSSGLLYADQSGAINEAYADLFGNFTDTSSTSWLIGEQTIRGALRNMLAPGAFGQPAHFSGYVPRTGACGPWPWSCDSGGVHTNSGIINRAHATLSDGITGVVSNIGRERVERLAFFVMTQRLPSSATMSQVAGATRDACDMFVARGVTTRPSGLIYTSTHCDAVSAAFNNVGLNPSLSSGWAEPTLGFEATDVIYPNGLDGRPQLMPGRCAVSNILLSHRIPLLGTSLQADYDPLTPLGSRTSILDWVATTNFDFTGVASTPRGPLPMGTPLKLHRVHWTSAYGIRPSYNTDPSLGASCVVVQTQQRPSASVNRGFDFGEWWGTANVLVGNSTPTAFDSTNCSLSEANLELLDGAGSVIAGPGRNISHTITHWFLFVPVNFTARAAVVSSPTPGSTNLSGTVNIGWDLGRTVRVRWWYEFTPSLGFTGDCNPL